MRTSDLSSDDDDSEAEEAALTARTGEAQEAPSGGAGDKRALVVDEENLEDVYGKPVKKKRAPAPKLEEKDLIGADGLIRIPLEFKAIRYPKAQAQGKNKANTKQKLDAAATYCRNLVSAYESFAFDIFPSQAPQDVLLKIEKLGAKKEVKSFLQVMREQVRNNHVEKLFGRAQADKMLQELDVGLQQQQEQQQGDVTGELEVEESSESHPEQQPTTDSMAATATSTGTTTTTTATASMQGSTNANATAPGGYQDDEEEEEAVFDDNEEEEGESAKGTSAPKNTSALAGARPVSTNDKKDHDDDDDDDDDLLQQMTAARAPSGMGDGVSQASSKTSSRRRVMDDDDDSSDEEEEATFEDVTAETAVPAKSNNNESIVNGDNEVEMHHVLEDKDDVDVDGNNEFDETSRVDKTAAAVEAGDAEMDHVVDDKDEGDNGGDEESHETSVGINSATVAEANSAEKDHVLGDKDDCHAGVDKGSNGTSLVDNSAAAPAEPEEEVRMMHIEQQSPSSPSTVNGASQTQDSTIVPTQSATQETMMGNGASPTQDSTIDPPQSATQETIVPTMTAASQLDSPSQSGSDNDN
jgi:hypothetical protein